MDLHGQHLIGSTTSRDAEPTFEGTDPRTGAALGPGYAEATSDEIDRAAREASAAAETLRDVAPGRRAELLERIAEEILSLGDPLLERAERETALPRPRLESERGRTVGQLRAFATQLRQGLHFDTAVDPAEPDRKPLPKPDVRRTTIALGPVAVFGASNFPLAFSVAGGDTASALAAGCPVVVKAHPRHPGTSELVGRAIQRAVEALELPAGTFSLLHGEHPDVGQQLVTHPRVRAVAFTGSLRGGHAIFEAAAERPEPIPVFAEMGSINPVFVLPGAAAARGDAIAQGLVGSLTLGVGQFCTNPGVWVLLRDPGSDELVRRAAELVASTPPGTMLHAGILHGYRTELERMRNHPSVRLLAGVEVEPGAGRAQAGAFLLETDAGDFVDDEELRNELFGPAALVVRCASPSELADVTRALPGTLTATLHGSDDDIDAARELLPILRDRAGRLVWNGFPTGVEVCPAMHHGGPWPATTMPHFTSVGATAIRRFLRPICLQGFPTELLPPELAAR